MAVYIYTVIVKLLLKCSTVIFILTFSPNVFSNYAYSLPDTLGYEIDRNRNNNDRNIECYFPSHELANVCKFHRSERRKSDFGKNKGGNGCHHSTDALPIFPTIPGIMCSFFQFVQQLRSRTHSLVTSLYSLPSVLPGVFIFRCSSIFPRVVLGNSEDRVVKTSSTIKYQFKRLSPFLGSSFTDIH